MRPPIHKYLNLPALAGLYLMLARIIYENVGPVNPKMMRDDIFGGYGIKYNADDNQS